jgi:gliding motility-associated lipoprotein GldD
MRTSNSIILTWLISSALLMGCREISAPKPRGYFRIDLPEKKYTLFEKTSDAEGDPIPVTFEYPAYGTISLQPDGLSGQGWFNIDFPQFGAKLYLTYRSINNNLPSLIEESYTLSVRNHITKADAINEELISFPGRNVHGILFDLKGNTATALQFFTTDSTKNFFRGSLYFNAEPDADSLAPVIEFFRQDIKHIIGTLKWDNQI